MDKRLIEILEIMMPAIYESTPAVDFERLQRLLKEIKDDSK